MLSYSHSTQLWPDYFEEIPSNVDHVAIWCFEDVGVTASLIALGFNDFINSLCRQRLLHDGTIGVVSGTLSSCAPDSILVLVYRTPLSFVIRFYQVPWMFF